MRKKFNEAEILFPNQLGTKVSLMAAYSYYFKILWNAIAELESL